MQKEIIRKELGRVYLSDFTIDKLIGFLENLKKNGYDGTTAIRINDSFCNIVAICENVVEEDHKIVGAKYIVIE